MGEPIKIMDRSADGSTGLRRERSGERSPCSSRRRLARDLIELSGYQVGRDIDIAITGLRRRTNC